MSDDNSIPDGTIPVGDVEYWAALGNLKQTENAIRGGADVNAVSAGNHSALHAAATNGHVDVVELLLANGANPTDRLATGETAADLAKLAGFDALAQRLSQ